VINSFKAGASDKTIEISGITPGIDEVAQTFASLASSNNHLTVFKSGQISTVQEKDVTDGTGAVTGKIYLFSGKLIMGDK
jgi:hypothetical protein